MTDNSNMLKKEARLALFVQATLAMTVVFNIVNILALLAQGRLLATIAGGGTVSDEQVAVNDNRIQMLGYIHIALLILSVIVWLAWTWRAYRNLQLVGSRQTDTSPGWAVGYWFIPIINLFKPFQITKELWSRSAQGNHSGLNRDKPDASLVGFWWIVWIFSSAFNRYVSRQSRDAETIASLLSSNKELIISNVVGVLASVLAFAVVTRIHRYQQQLSIEAVAPDTLSPATPI